VETQKPDPNFSDISPEEPMPTETVEGRLAASVAECERLTAEKDELQDRLLRTTAEFENFRWRAERERCEYLQFAAGDLVREILPALDDFERALQHETSDREYAKGVELIYQRLSDTLRKMGLEPIETAGARFDPTVHEAVQRVETEEAEDQTVLSEFQKGYTFRGKLLRPAMVRVAVKP
jgi:molecular chaperone GrpE